MKKILIIVGGLAVVAILVYVIFMDTDKGLEVNGQVVQEKDLIEEVSASGRIQPKNMVDITAELNAEIIGVPVKEGDWVERGQLLLVLDTVQAGTSAQQARYALDEMRARLSGTESSRDQAVEEFERQERLYQQNLTSETIYKNAKYAAVNAESAYNAMLAQVKQLEAGYDRQMDNLSKSRIKAPMSGVITYLDAEVGEIAAAQTAYSQGKTLMTISNLNVFEVEVEVDETEINKIELNQEAAIEVDAFPDTTFEGRVVEIGNTAILATYGSQDQSTNFNVKVTFADANPRLRPGMSATVDIVTSRKEGVMTIPFSSVVVRAYDLDSLSQAREQSAAGSSMVEEVQAAETEGAGQDGDTTGGDKVREEHKGVFLIREGVAQFVKIETGIADQRSIEVTEGLSQEDTVVAGPYRILRNIQDGQTVKVNMISENEQHASRSNEE